MTLFLKEWQNKDKSRIINNIQVKGKKQNAFNNLCIHIEATI